VTVSATSGTEATPQVGDRTTEIVRHKAVDDRISTALNVWQQIDDQLDLRTRNKTKTMLFTHPCDRIRVLLIIVRPSLSLSLSIYIYIYT